MDKGSRCALRPFARRDAGRRTRIQNGPINSRLGISEAAISHPVIMQQQVLAQKQHNWICFECLLKGLSVVSCRSLKALLFWQTMQESDFLKMHQEVKEVRAKGPLPCSEDKDEVWLVHSECGGHAAYPLAIYWAEPLLLRFSQSSFQVDTWSKLIRLGKFSIWHVRLSNEQKLPRACTLARKENRHGKWFNSSSGVIQVLCALQ